MRLPEPRPAVKRALALLPHRPGVYILRDDRGRVIYVGRSRDLATRARSYWTDLRDRPHLIRMLPRVEWLEPVLCTSEHEAAFLESDLLDRHRTRYNRTLGMESCVWMRLEAGARSPGLEVVHEPSPHDGATWFGPYLGWEPARLAAAALLRLHPLHYAGTAIGRTEREMAKSLGVGPRDVAAVARRIELVLRREPGPVRAALQELEAVRDRAADRLMFEYAKEVQEQIRGLLWISEPQKLSALEPLDHDFCAVAGGDGGAALVILSLRGGRMVQRHFRPLAHAGAWPEELAHRRDGVGLTLPGHKPHRLVHADWADLARENAELMLKLSGAGAIGPLGWRAPKAAARSA
jgi:excinuclease ABC subunit C